MKEINSVNVFLNKQQVGTLGMTDNHLCAFEYDADFLKNGFSISPFYLPFKNEVFIAKRAPFHGGFGVFDDCLPDGWGNLILDRYLKGKGVNPYELNILQRLALVGTNGRGALEFHPDWSESTNDERINFDQLANDAGALLASDFETKGIDTLYRYGGSPGGARPKVFVKIDNEEWLVKFKAANDPENIGETEYNYSLLAKECGINMPETKLFEGKYFGTKRFDRTKNGKIHTISAAGLLNANFQEPSLDYEGLLQACLVLTKNMEEVLQLFRIMVFNVLIENKDDHAKNFSFQWIENEWRLAPAYDLLPSDGFNGHHTTTVNANGKPTRNDILTVADKIGINPQIAKAIFEEIEEKVKAR
ncbi:MAG: type II toxin-antitoxin system HipA family toxin [Cryomorphaceae bacterium]|nr:type II toxin-antitoxin system HipA family toxin [Cryomorphaceae bacterium]